MQCNICTKFTVYYRSKSQSFVILKKGTLYRFRDTLRKRVLRLNSKNANFIHKKNNDIEAIYNYKFFNNYYGNKAKMMM